jgi:ubiquinone/menaquinone biosynthesis C-methylase UbiE
MNPNRPAQDETEFDAFAKSYDNLHNKCLRFAGESQDYYSEYKIQDVRSTWAGLSPSPPRRILDFGAGTGSSIPFWYREFPHAQLIAADVSPKCLESLRETYGHEQTLLLKDGRILLPDKSVDIAFAACVFHHIAPADHLDCLREMHRVLRPGGACFIFEHNPLNPLTRYVVNRCEFDRNAILIRSGKMKRLLQTAGFLHPRVAFRIFFPGHLSRLRPLERGLKWLPLGGQYYTYGIRSE